MHLGDAFRCWPTLTNDTSPQLLGRLRMGELDAALVVLPAQAPAPEDLSGATLARENMHVVEARDAAPRPARRVSPLRRSWVLNPSGCLVREEIRSRLERRGESLAIAAEVHSPELQLALVAGGVGSGIVRASLMRTHPLRSRLRVVPHTEFEIPVRIVVYRAHHLGAREQVARELQRLLEAHFTRVVRARSPRR